MMKEGQHARNIHLLKEFGGSSKSSLNAKSMLNTYSPFDTQSNPANKQKVTFQATKNDLRFVEKSLLSQKSHLVSSASNGGILIRQSKGAPASGPS